VIKTDFTGARLTSPPLAETASITGGSRVHRRKLVQRLVSEDGEVKALAR